MKEPVNDYNIFYTGCTLIAYLSHNNPALSPVCVCVYSGGCPFIVHGWYAGLCVSLCACMCVYVLWISARVHGQTCDVTICVCACRLGMLRAQVGRRWMSNHVWHLDRVYEVCYSSYLCMCAWMSTDTSWRLIVTVA